jgi:hypothetical protein
MVLADAMLCALAAGVVVTTLNGRTARVVVTFALAGWLRAIQTKALAPPPTTVRAETIATTIGQRRPLALLCAGCRCIASKS